MTSPGIIRQNTQYGAIVLPQAQTRHKIVGTRKRNPRKGKGRRLNATALANPI
jgi:hypothetical protein